MTAAYPAPVRSRRRAGLGLVAFIASAAALVIGMAGIWLAGFFVGRVVRLVDYPDLIQETEAQLWDTLERAIGAVIVLVVAWVLHALVALWGLIQGIVATSLGRGRGWGIAAIVLASSGWMLLLAFTQHALLAGLVGLMPFTI